MATATFSRKPQQKTDGGPSIPRNTQNDIMIDFLVRTPAVAGVDGSIETGMDDTLEEDGDMNDIIRRETTNVDGGGNHNNGNVFADIGFQSDDSK